MEICYKKWKFKYLILMNRIKDWNVVGFGWKNICGAKLKTKTPFQIPKLAPPSHFRSCSRYAYDICDTLVQFLRLIWDQHKDFLNSIQSSDEFRCIHFLNLVHSIGIPSVCRKMKTISVKENRILTKVML